MKPLLVLPVAAMLLSACQTDASDEQSLDTCGASDLSGWVGTHHTEHDFSDPNHPVRIIPPNSAVTMDYLESRLNVDVDDEGVIIRFWCG